MTTIGNVFGHFHPALVHFPIALLTVGAAFEVFAALRKEGRSAAGRVFLLLGTAGAGAAAASGLVHFDDAGYRGLTLEAARIHRVLGLASAGLACLTVVGGGLRSGEGPRGHRLLAYRVLYGATAVTVGLAGHYGGWIVFGWGHVWTF